MSGAFVGGIFGNYKGIQVYRQRKTHSKISSIAYLNRKSQFASCSSSWLSVGSTNKQLYADFAVAEYRPKGFNENRPFSGFNCYVGLERMKASTFQLPDVGEIRSWPDDTSLSYTIAQFTPGANVPTYNVLPNVTIYDNNFWPLGLSGTNIHVDSDGYMDYLIEFIGMPEDVFDKDQLEDTNGTRININIYWSEPLKYVGQIPQNKMNTLVLSTKRLTFSPGELMGATGIRLFSDWTSVRNIHKFYPRGGQVRLATAYAVCPLGTCALIGSQYLTISQV